MPSAVDLEPNHNEPVENERAEGRRIGLREELPGPSFVREQGGDASPGRRLDMLAAERRTEIGIGFEHADDAVAERPPR